MRDGLPRAASVVLLREAAGAGGTEPFDLYMLRRHDSARFAPGAYTFPGGVLEAQDWACAEVSRLADDSALAALHARLAGPDPLRSPDAATTAALFACAARELFEETGVLLARAGGGNPLVMADPEHWQGLRDELLAGRIAFGALLAGAGLWLDPDDLIGFSHWITPEGQPIRYNTHFFLGLLPRGQAASHYPGEQAGGLWITPGEGLARHRRGEFPMVPVQTAHLERFARFASLAELLAHARTKALPPVLPVLGPRGREAALAKELPACW